MGWRMTNAEMLIKELGALDGERLFEALGACDLANKLCDLSCEECCEEHGGECPSGENGKCPITPVKWLELPCKRESILSEVMG